MIIAAGNHTFHFCNSSANRLVAFKTLAAGLSTACKSLTGNTEAWQQSPNNYVPFELMIIAMKWER
jgi:hypothetical protein